MTKSSPEPEKLTELLQAWQRGDPAAGDELMPAVMQQLKWIARHYLRNEYRNRTLETDGLLNEALIRIFGQHAVWQNRGHFYAVLSTSMRRVLIDYAKTRTRAKRGGKDENLPLEAAALISEREKNLNDLLDLDEALRRLEQINELQARIIELRYFGNLSIEEIAETLGITEIGVKNKLRASKAWLYQELTRKNKAKNPEGGEISVIYE